MNTGTRILGEAGFEALNIKAGQVIEPAVITRARQRWQAMMRASGHEPGPWFTIKDADTAPADEGGDPVAGPAEVLIYGAIGDAWMPEDVTAYSFVQALAGIDASEITLRINSPGGFVYDGITIYNALRDHPAKVSTVVDGVAASIASVVALAGDTVTMNRGAEMMIHDAWGLAIGNAADMAEMSAYLHRQSDKIADIYAARAGGTPESWRALMTAETWFSAAEAVEAGLATGSVAADEAAAQEAEAKRKAAEERKAQRAAPATDLFTSRPQAGEISTDVAPEAAPDVLAASAASEAAARQRRRTVDAAKASLALASHP